MRISYIDHLGNEIINVNTYRGAGRFSDGLAFVRFQNGLIGYIDKTNQLVIAPQFTEAWDFADGLARVKYQGRSSIISEEFSQRGYLVDKSPKGYIDQTGKVVIETNFEKIFDFSEGVAVATKESQNFLIDKTGKIILSLDNREIDLELCGNQKFSEGLLAAYNVNTRKCGFIDKTGTFIIEPVFNDAANFAEGFARVSIVENHRELLGFINTEGHFAIPPKFDIDHDFRRNANDFSEGVAGLIKIPTQIDKYPNFVYINKAGEEILATEYFLANPFYEGLAVVYDDKIDKYGFINKSGEPILPVQYYSANDFSEGLALVVY